MQQTPLEKTYRCRSEVARRHVGGEVILVPVSGKLADMQRLFVLTPVGEFIWDRLDGERATKQIVADLVSDFEVGEDEARDDTLAFIDELRQNDLITED